MTPELPLAVKIFIVSHDYYYEGSEVLAVFSSRTSAEKFVELKIGPSKFRMEGVNHWNLGSSGFSIEEQDLLQ